MQNKPSTRRQFLADALKLAGATAVTGMLPESILRAQSIPAATVTGTLQDVKHVVILMQENRSFDHYLGTLRGARGFGDPRPVVISNGYPVWRQPWMLSYVFPFNPSPPVSGVANGDTYYGDLDHSWGGTHNAWNNGKYDNWADAKGSGTMYYFTQNDIPFYYALASAFTVCDDYHCSMLGPTDPNRLYLWTGCCGNVPGYSPYTTNTMTGTGWTTMPERLNTAGVTWKFYQDKGNGLDSGHGYGEYNGSKSDLWWNGNYGDNVILNFRQYQNLGANDPLAPALNGTQIDPTGGGKEYDTNLFSQLRADVANGTLPQVSWIAAPYAYCEHPSWAASGGEWYVSNVLNALTSNPAVWASTVLLVMYDENDGLFDHMPPAVPSSAYAGTGQSTVSTAAEFVASSGSASDGSANGDVPIGLGPRVPMFVISPWSKGGKVNSQVFDHTSVIRFLEARFGLQETNITPWRRAVCGDLTSAFDFANPDQTIPSIPAAASNMDPNGSTVSIPAATTTAVPAQTAGRNTACRLPYEFFVQGKVNRSAKTLALMMTNTGTAGVHLQAWVDGTSTIPRQYTIGAGTSACASLSDTLALNSGGGYDYSKGDNWFPEHERVKAFAGRRGEPLDLGTKRQVVMADSVMMKALGIPLWLARDVSSMPWHGPLSRPDHARNVLSRHAKSAITYLSPARAADRRMLQAYARAKVEIQDRIALMARGFTLRDNPDEMLALVKRYGGAMPVVSIAVDPHSLAAALGRKHDPAFIRRVRALGKLDNAHFDEANARIEIGGKNRHLELDDLDHLFKWLDAASEGGFVLRLETAPSRALVSAEDQRTLAGTNDAYHDYVRTFDALESWAREHPGQDAPHVMVTFHGWDAVLEPAPGDGHMKLVEAVLDREALDWVHLGLSYATHGADFIANQDLTAALARKLVEYTLHAPDKFARLHGADALTRVFERVGTQTLANQHQVLFAEVERVGLAQGMTPDALAALRTDLYEGHTTALMDRARQATIQYSKDHPVKAGPVTKRIKSAQYGARQAGDTWLGNYGKPATEPVQLKIDAQAGQSASSIAFWRAVAADPKLAIDETKPVIVNRDIAAQPSHQRVTAQQAALAQLNALRVHRPSFGKRDWMWSLGFGGTMAGASTLVALNVFNGMNMMSSDALSHANTALFVGARAGRVFGAMHQGAVQSLQSGDPRAVHDVLDRLQRSLAQQLSASVHGYNPARLEQLDLLANETRVKASHFVEMHRQGLIGFDDAAAQIKELSADLLANMQGMVGGTSLTQLHRGNSRRLLGLVGRGSAIVGYSGTIAVGVHGLMSTPTVAGALTTASAALAATYTGLVYAVSAHRVNADKRSRVVRLIDSTSDFVGVASGIAGTIAQYDKGHAGLAVTAATSTVILLGARLNTHFPNATRWVRKYPTALILVPIGIWGFTQLQSLFFGSPSGGSGSSTHKPQPTPSSPSHQPPPQTGGTPTTGLAPGATATQPPGTGTPGGTSGTPGSTAPAQPSAPPSPAAQPYIVVSGDSLWVIADAHRQSLLDAAHVSPADQKTMTRAQQDARALNEILQLNPGLASAPNVLYAGQSINVG